MEADGIAGTGNKFTCAEGQAIPAEQTVSGRKGDEPHSLFQAPAVSTHRKGKAK
jgi:hypothetical protein